MSLVQIFEKYNIENLAQSVYCGHSTKANSVEITFKLPADIKLKDFLIAFDKVSDTNIDHNIINTIDTFFSSMDSNKEKKEVPSTASLPTPPPPPPLSEVSITKEESEQKVVGENKVVMEQPSVIEEKKESPKNNNGNGFIMPPLPTAQASESKKATSYNKQADVKQGSFDSDESIKDVQKLAIQLQLNTSGLTYKEFATKAFEFANNAKETIPPMDELTYKDAIQLIHYGNERSKTR